MPPCDEWYLADGTNIKRITEKEIVIQKSPFSVQFLHIYPSTYYETWQEKLRSGENNEVPRMIKG